MAAACVVTGYVCYRWGYARGVVTGRVEQFEVQRAELERVRNERNEALEEMAKTMHRLNVGKEGKAWLSRWAPS